MGRSCDTMGPAVSWTLIDVLVSCVRSTKFVNLVRR